jgi:Flp pilus assembly protein TadD
MVGELLARLPTAQEQSQAFNIRAEAHEFLGHFKQAEHDYNQAIRFAPNDPNLYSNRAEFWDQRGQHYLAALDRLMASALEMWQDFTR